MESMSLMLEMPKVVPLAAKSDLAPRGALLMRVLAVLEQEKIPCCLLHGYETFPHAIEGDVDCLIPASFLPQRLAEVLHAHRELLRARVVQWFVDGAHFVVLASPDED